MGVEIGAQDVPGQSWRALAAGGELSGTPGGSLARTARRVTTDAPHAPAGDARPRVRARGARDMPAAAHVYNERFDGVLPAAVARPLDAADVRGAVRWLLAHDTPLRARSGGHSYAGYSTLSGGRRARPAQSRPGSPSTTAQRTATVGAGAQLIDVYAGLARRGATIPAGSCPSVGIAGVTLGGGMGLAARALGLTTDNLLGARIVTADGKLRQVDRTHRSRTCCGRCAAAAAATSGWSPSSRSGSIRSRAAPRTSSSPGRGHRPPRRSRPGRPGRRTRAPELTSILHLNAGGGSPSISVSGQYLGPASDLGGLLGADAQRPGRERRDRRSGLSRTAAALGRVSHTRSRRVPHRRHGARGNASARASFRAKSDYVKPRPPAGRPRRILVHAAERRASQPGSGALLFDAYGGAINRVASRRPPRSCTATRCSASST